MDFEFIKVKKARGRSTRFQSRAKRGKAVPVPFQERTKAQVYSGRAVNTPVDENHSFGGYIRNGNCFKLNTVSYFFVLIRAFMVCGQETKK